MNDFARYDRQIKLSEVGESGQKKLQDAKVLIVGVGGLGCPSAIYLTAAGVGKIGLIDHDNVDQTNLHRQILFTENDIGRNKAEAAREALIQRNSSISIESYSDPLSLENALEIIDKYDLILDGTDNFQTKYLINDACVKINKPFVGAAIYKYQGQISVFNYQGGPSYRCLYPTHHHKDNNNCEETGVIGVLPGILGTLQANEALKLILGIGSPLNGVLKIVDTLSGRDQLIEFQRNEEIIEQIKNQPLKLELSTCEIEDAERIFLDVREPFEQPQPTNENVIQIPLNQLANRYGEIPRETKVHVFCQSGIRSKKATSLLKKDFGFDNLVDAGGIEELLK